MAYIAPIHKPTSVRHALSCRLLSPDEESLVLAKANRLEIWRLSEGLLTQTHTTTINGTIAILQRLQPKDSKTDMLFVGTDRFEYFTMIWNTETSRLDVMNAHKEPGEEHMRESQSVNRCLVDPSGRFMAMHLWEGVLTISRLGDNKRTAMTLGMMDQVRLSELFIKASTFLYTETGHPTIAFLYQTRSDSDDTKLITYRLTEDDRHTKVSRFDPEKDKQGDIVDVPDPSAAMLIPVRKAEEEVKRHIIRNIRPTAKAHIGGLIVVGETRLLYIDEATNIKVESALKEASIFVAWAEYDITHYFLADDYGNLHLLEIENDGVVVTGMKVTYIGETSRASHLVYLGDNLLFVASHYGDSQLFRLGLDNSDSESMLQLVQTISNIGPILDFTVMDMGHRGDDGQLGNEYSSGQARIVTCSGVYKDGTLRSVRSGVGLEDIGILAEVEHCRGLFSLKSYGSPTADTLVVSLLTETRVFRFDQQGEIEEVESFAGLAFNQQTLLAMNLASGELLQVTPAAATLLDAESGVTIASWVPEGGRSIINASANIHWLLLSIEGTGLVSLSIANELQTVQEKDISSQDQVACVHVAPQLPDVGVVGFWCSGTVSIIDLNTLEPIHGGSLRTSKDDASIPRDLALVQVLPSHASGPTLFISMQDGNVITFNVSPTDLSLSNRKQVILGMRQARFHLLPPLARPDGGARSTTTNNNTFSIFATTEHPSLIYGSDEGGAASRVVYAAVTAATAEEATYVCAFDAAPETGFADCVVVATEGHIKMARIDRERQTYEKPLPMGGEMVRRIAYSEREKVFGLGCIRRELVGGEEVVSSEFRLVDEVLFDKVGRRIQLGGADGTGVTELVEAVVRAELRDSYGNLAERFLVGTSYLPDAESGSGAAGTDVRGRILVLGVDSDRNPYKLLAHELKGACRCLAVMEDEAGPLIVAGLTKTIVVCRYEETSDVTATLTKLASYRPSTYPADISVSGRTIAVADLMKSVALVEYVPPSSGGAGEEGENDKGSTSRRRNAEPRLVERARHFQSVWATAVGYVQDGLWLEADAQGNLLVLRKNVEGVTAEDKRRMEVTSEMNLGEMVNRIRPIEVETTPGATVIPKAFLGTVEGGIYMFGTVAPHAQGLLLRFQTRLADIIEPVGDIDFRTYRAFRNAEREGDGPFRFLDGELLERFLDVDEATQEEICRGLGSSVEDMRNIVEELRRMH
ncbi:hypothetical protein VTK26DRAFT_7185 [Humicola hyalothermophila]